MPGFDVFISYKSEERSWALRLAEDLARYGFTVFVDHDPERGLQAGEGWKERLRQEIVQARHFLLLWSSKIAVSSYVVNEIDIRRAAQLPITVARLDDSKLLSTLDDSVQAFRDLIGPAQAVGAGGAYDIGFFAWHSAVRHLVESTPLADEPGAVVVEIPIVVVAMTRDQAVELVSRKNVVPEIKDSTFTEVMALLEGTAPFDPERYGPRPEDWRPFEPEATGSTVEEVMFGFDAAKRSWYRDHPGDGPPTRYAFVPYSAALRNPKTSVKARQHLQSRPSLIVLDPVSLMHNQVHKDVIANGLPTLTQAFVIGLGPQLAATSPPMSNYFRSTERSLFEALMMNDPHDRARSLFHPTLNTCVLNVCHDFELSRWLSIASEGIVSWTDQRRTGMAPEFAGIVRSGRSSPPRLVP